MSHAAPHHAVVETWLRQRLGIQAAEYQFVDSPSPAVVTVVEQSLLYREKEALAVYTIERVGLHTVAVMQRLLEEEINKGTCVVFAVICTSAFHYFLARQPWLELWKKLTFEILAG